MTKTELVDAIARRTELTKSDVDAAITGFFEVVADVVSKGDDSVNLPGWIKFEQTTRSARTGRNPQTGEAIQVPETKAVKITAGSKLKKAAKGEA